MDRRALGAATPARRFAALAVLVAAGLTLPAAHPRPGPAAPAWHAAEGMVMRLAGPPGRAPVRPASRMYSLTIKGFSLAGTPDTGDLVQLFNVDDTTLISGQAGAGVFHDGVVKYSVPAGHYFAVAEFGGSGHTPGSHFVILPQFSVTGNRTLRTSAADAAGGTVTETITSAYRTGR
jgi:hypothetical protein